MNIDAHEFLTDEQKSQLGTALFEKMLNAIEAVQFYKGKKIDFSEVMVSEIESTFERYELYSEIDTSKIGKALTDKLLGSI